MLGNTTAPRLLGGSFWGPKLQRSPRRAGYGLPPDELLRAGILSDPSTAKGAHKRAEGLVAHGKLAAARTILLPHQTTDNKAIRPKIFELLGVCAMHMGGESHPLFRQALRDFRENADSSGQARVFLHLGQLGLDRGRFKEADVYFRNAASVFTHLGDQAQVAAVLGLRARLRVRSGRFVQALRRVDEALRLLITIGRPREQAFAHLDRAVILAHMDNGPRCARELVFAERLLANTGNRIDRVQARLRRSETLFILGNSKKAVMGLKAVLPEVVALDHVCTRAWTHLMLGRALSTAKPVDARRNLMRARHLYASVGSDYGLAQTDVFLAVVEHRMGLNPLNRLRALDNSPMNEWPLFASHLQLARAELIDEPKRSLRMIAEAREFAEKSKNRYLSRLVEAAAQRQREGNRQWVVYPDDNTPPAPGKRPVGTKENARVEFLPPGSTEPAIFPLPTQASKSGRFGKNRRTRLVGPSTRNATGMARQAPQRVKTAEADSTENRPPIFAWALATDDKSDDRASTRVV